ncbi:lymphocyte antigen 6L-like [Orycteropus afer afer]|uniref:Lymphocyte antigen 6L-like n=1 Tax=Orycteropus afer afer TaxID=1230840 RepID=A0AC54Z635_ORYAF|nr:lymphocyte antigen 6L-like [Orycteropus afer afer]
MGGLAVVPWALLVSVQMTGVCGVITKPVHLICYECFRVGSHADCDAHYCSSNDTVCISHEAVMTSKQQTITKISKRCAPRCPNTNSQQEFFPQKEVHVKLTRQCCARNFCNRAPPTHQGPWTLPGALLLLRALL